MNDFSSAAFRNENFLDLRLYQCGLEQCASTHSFGPFIRNHYIFHYVISGRGYLDVTDEHGETSRYHVEKDQGFLICPGQLSTYCADKHQPWKYVWLEFDGLRVSEYLANAGLGSNQPIYSPKGSVQDNDLQDEMLYLVEHQKASTLHQIGHLFLFLDQLIQSSTTKREATKAQLRDLYIQESVAYMEQNYQRDLTVEEIAEVCKLNRSYFSKLFKETMGCPPQEFLIRMRLSKATELMKTSPASIGNISQICGYPNQLHFSRAFKKRYGLSPREWRSQNKLRA